MPLKAQKAWGGASVGVLSPACTAYTYLHATHRWEAQQLPSAVVSSVAPPTPASGSPTPGQLQDLADPAQCDPALLPLRSWTNHFLATFEHLRDCMQRWEARRSWLWEAEEVGAPPAL